MSASVQNTILLVEDDEELAHWTQEYLSNKGFNVQVTASGVDAVARINSSPPDLVLLDGMLPDLDGLDVCRQVRPTFANPIIMLTARDEEIDEVLGLEVGADDYITKPVRARALLARIRGHLRRNQSQVQHNQQAGPVSQIRLNELLIDKQNLSVTLRGQAVSITSAEFDVLWLLAEKAGEVVSRQELVNQLRGFDYDGFDRSIDLRVSRIRKKLGDDPNEPYLIKTIWGKGYLFARESW
ncbi:response regulator [Planctobacterium marinum]|uniref:response regulator n=1 Tax=Planctobacterium marinum TaxID=1631968 RepID=UPI001E6198F7|nr:response regulator transcription factor [Planctobacterium marinum]MCC2607002.1 response regulator transcription factor [Planctobacterium marinum]